MRRSRLLTARWVGHYSTPMLMQPCVDVWSTSSLEDWVDLKRLLAKAKYEKKYQRKSIVAS